MTARSGALQQPQLDTVMIWLMSPVVMVTLQPLPRVTQPTRKPVQPHTATVTTCRRAPQVVRPIRRPGMRPILTVVTSVTNLMIPPGPLVLTQVWWRQTV